MANLAKFTIDKYTSGEWAFPSTEVSPEEKRKPDYCRKCSESIYSKHVKNRTGVTYAYSSLFSELRKYGRGMQSEDKYKRFINSANADAGGADGSDIDGVWTTNRDYERQGWMNISWQIVSPAQKIRSMIKGLFDEIDFNVMADAIDVDSGAEEEDRKWRAWATTRSEVARALNRLKANAGLPMQRPDFIPESIEELEMYEQAGGFKMGFAIAMEKLLKHTGDTSNWEDLKEKLLDDLIDMYVAFVKEYVDEETGKSRWRYVDPEDIVIQYSKYEDFRDSEYAGEFHEMKISELRRSMLQHGYSEEDIKEVAKTYCGYLGNPATKKWQEYNKTNASGLWRYDDFNVTVFETEWIDQEKTKKIKYTNKYGKTRFIPYDEEKKKKLGKREELVSSTKKVLYGCRWIVGSEIVFDHGPVYYQPKPSPKKVCLTYKGVKVDGQSLTQTLVPIYDDIQKGWLRYQNSCAIAFDDGYVVDWGMIQNISDGETKFSPIQVIQMYKRQGIMPFRSTPVGHATYRGGATVPIQKIPGGMGESLNQAISRLALQFKLIEDLTGLSPVALGATPDPNAPVTTTERSLQSTHNALKPMIRALFRIKDSLARVSSIRIQQLCKWDEYSRKEYEKVVGEGDIASIVIAKDSGAEYGIKLEARPTSIDKMDMIRAAEQALAPGRDGVPGIEYEDYLFVKERINADGNLKEIRLYLSLAKKRAKAQAFQQQQALIQQQTQGNLQMKQAEAQKMQAEQNLRTQGEVTVENVKHQNKMKEIYAQANADYVKDLQEQLVKEQTASV